jgi:hypothetical protein
MNEVFCLFSFRRNIREDAANSFAYLLYEQHLSNKTDLFGSIWEYKTPNGPDTLFSKSYKREDGMLDQRALVLNDSDRIILATNNDFEFYHIGQNLNFTFWFEHFLDWSFLTKFSRVV